MPAAGSQAERPVGGHACRPAGRKVSVDGFEDLRIPDRPRIVVVIAEDPDVVDVGEGTVAGRGLVKGPRPATMDQLQVAPLSLKPVGAAALPVWVAW